MTATTDVFLSYAHADSTLADTIQGALSAAGLRVWRDTTRVELFQGITQAVTEGLKHSKAFLAIYSDQYALSKACQWELATAFVAAQQAANPVDRVLVVNPETHFHHIQPIQLRDSLTVSAAGELDSAQLVDLADHIARRLSTVETTLGSVRGFFQTPAFGASILPPRRFVGRRDVLWQVHTALHEDQFPFIADRTGPTIVQIVGLAGIGKSLLAQEYSLRFQAAFPGGIFRLSAYGSADTDSPMPLDQLEAERQRQICNILHQVLPEAGSRNQEATEIEGVLSHFLTARGMPCLWIVDDFPERLPISVLSRWIGPVPVCKTLVTTRSTEYASVGSQVHLQALQPEDAYVLITSRRTPRSQVEQDAATRIAQSLGYHALAVDIAGAALDASAGFQTFAEFEAALASVEGDYLEFAAHLAPLLPSGHQRSVSATIATSLNMLGEEGWEFMRLAAVLAEAPIPPKLIADIFRSISIGMMPVFADLVTASDTAEEEFRRRAIEGVRQADVLSLTERDERSEGARSVHRVVARSVLFRDKAPERQAVMRAASAAALHRLLKARQEPTHAEELESVLAHARQVAARAHDIIIWERRLDRDAIPNTFHSELAGGDLSLGRLLVSLAAHDASHQRVESAEALLRRALELVGGGYPPELRVGLLLRPTLELAVLLRTTGRDDEAIELCRQALGQYQESPRRDPKTEAIIRTHLAASLQRVGRLREAMEQWQVVHRIELTERGSDAEEVTNALQAMGALALQLKDHQAAHELYEEALRRCIRMYGRHGRQTVDALHGSARALLLLGQNDKAIQRFEEVLSLQRATLGDRHPTTIKAIGELAVAFAFRGSEFEAHGGVKARSLLEEAYSLSCEVNGPGHHLSIAYLTNLIQTLSLLRESEAAVALGISGVLSGLTALGPHSHHVELLLESIARAMHGQQVTQSTLDVISSFVDELTGAPSMICSPEALKAVTQWAVKLSDYGVTREVLTKILMAQKAHVGWANEDTRYTASVLGPILLRAGEFAEAESCLRDALTACVAIRHTEDEETSVLAWNLFCVLCEAGDPAGDAMALFQERLAWLRRKEPEELTEYQKAIRAEIDGKTTNCDRSAT